ncbi:Ger(x)C family spore germination protein [Pseudalkalibacillus decolorationis]|uniref:Ger(x)C family spore germination protein n=1 Tax=Pseudalkalibacillus decolorationis TaxID=163879 RepID=UPI0021491E17|nr:Ger(x)C family spore germination protein [Pseudalkalibacillus decolorationis]
MRRSLGLLIIPVLSLTLLSGCWNRIELNELAIMVAMGIDKSDDQYVVTAQVVNPGEVAAKSVGAGKTPVSTYQETGSTLLEAIRRVTTIAPRKLYGAHLRVLVIGEELAKEGIGKVLDLLSRDQELRTDYFIVVAKGTKAENILKVLTTLETIPANKLYASLETSEKAWAPTKTITLDELIADLVSKGIQPSITGVQIKGDQKTGESKKNVEQIEPDSLLQYKGISVFKGDKLIGWLSEKESKGFNYTQGKVNSTIVEVPCTEGSEKKVGIELIRTKANLNGTVQNGSPKGTVQIRAEGNVAEVQCKKLDLTKTKTIDQLEKKVEQDIKGTIEAAISKAQEEFEVDMFGFGEAIHRSNPDFWKKVKKDWNQQFVDMPVEVKVDMKIRRIGTIGNSPLNKIK